MAAGHSHYGRHEQSRNQAIGSRRGSSGPYGQAARLLCLGQPGRFSDLSSRLTIFRLSPWRAGCLRRCAARTHSVPCRPRARQKQDRRHLGPGRPRGFSGPIPPRGSLLNRLPGRGLRMQRGCPRLRLLGASPPPVVQSRRDGITQLPGGAAGGGFNPAICPPHGGQSHT